MENEFPSNSLGERNAAKAEREVKQIVTGTVSRRKKPLGMRIKETFVNGADAKSVWGFVLFDVLVPAAKDMVVDAGTEALQRSFYGEGRGRSARGSSSRIGSPSRTTYNQMYTGASNAVGRASTGGRQMSQRARANQDFDDILIDTRVEAEEVLHGLYELIDTYDIATVADLYGMVGIQAGHTDKKWGWSKLPHAGVSRTRDGRYVLDLPKPDALD